MALSDSDSDHEETDSNNAPCTIATNTDNSGIVSTTDQATCTTPEVKITLDNQKEVYINSFGTKDLGLFKIPKKTYDTQVGHLNATKINNRCTQTDYKSCLTCNRQEHLMNSRWAYWVKDTEENCTLQPKSVYQSRETYKYLPLKFKPKPQTTNTPSTSKKPTPPHRLDIRKQPIYDPEKLKKCRESLKPRSPQLTPKPNRKTPSPKPSTSNATTLKIRAPGLITKPTLKRKPNSMVLDNATYEAICSRRTTRPTIMAPHRTILDLDGKPHTRDIALPTPNDKLVYHIHPVTR